MLEVGNTTSTVLTANQTIPFTTVFFDTNNKMAFKPSANALSILKKGIYTVGGTFVVTPSSTGVMTITMYANGIEQPTALSRMSVASGGTYTFTIPSKYIETISSTNRNTVDITFVTDTGCSLVSANAYVYYNEKVNE